MSSSIVFATHWADMNDHAAPSLIPMQTGSSLPRRVAELHPPLKFCAVFSRWTVPVSGGGVVRVVAVLRTRRRSKGSSPKTARTRSRLVGPHVVGVAAVDRPGLDRAGAVSRAQTKCWSRRCSPHGAGSECLTAVRGGAPHGARAADNEEFDLTGLIVHAGPQDFA